MIRGIAIVLVLAGALALISVAPNWLMELSGGGAESDQPGCDLMQGNCSWETESAQWQVSLSRLPDEQGSLRFRLAVDTTEEVERMHGVLRGESMYLGEYPVLLSKNAEDGTWLGTFTPPVCTVQDVMVWRIDLEIPGNPEFRQPQRLLFEVHRK